MRGGERQGALPVEASGPPCPTTAPHRDAGPRHFEPSRSVAAVRETIRQPQPGHSRGVTEGRARMWLFLMRRFSRVWSAAAHPITSERGSIYDEIARRAAARFVQCVPQRGPLRFTSSRAHSGAHPRGT